MSYLKSKVKEVLEYIKIVHQNQTIYQAKLLDLYEGSIEKYLNQSLTNELSSEAAKRAKQRSTPINILPKLIGKTSAVYSYGVDRDIDGNSVDSENVTFYEKDLALDSVMGIANEYLNLFRCCAIEPYLNKGKPSLRVLPPTQFTVYSDNQVNPMEMTIFVKFVGKVHSLTPRTNTQGVSLVDASNVIKEVELYHFYSDKEFLIVDAEGNIRYELMEENPEGINYYGKIPFVYLNTSKNLLIPLPNTDFFKMSLLIPKLITDMAYASMFQSHSILYTIDIEAEKLSANPDQLWDLKSSEGENTNPQIGAIKPEIDIEKVLLLIKDTLSIWFDSLGIKASGINNITAESAASGVAKAIDQSDVEEIRSKQKVIMRKAELNLWDLLATQHAYWATEEGGEVKPFSSSFNVNIQYHDPEPLVDYKTTIEATKLKYEAGLTSFRRAVQEANPDLSSEEVDELIKEIEQEKQDKVVVAKELFKEPKEEEKLVMPE